MQSTAPQHPPVRQRILPQVFIPTAAIVIALLALAAIAPDIATRWFTAAKSWAANDAGWFTILAVAGFLVFVVGVAISSYGRIKLGPDHSTPDYSYGSWFAMLFAAGMGIGLMFFGVAEPIMHYATPPVGSPESAAAARQAMRITFFHWGIHAWAIYAVVALSLRTLRTGTISRCVSVPRCIRSSATVFTARWAMP